MRKILFLIHDLGHGGAEKVLVNLVNNMDPEKFNITVMALFGGGVNEQFLKPHIRYKTVFPKVFPGNSHIMKLFSPKLLHKWFIREKYDIEVAYLEGPSVRIVSGCPEEQTKLVSWTHCTMNTESSFSVGFRSLKEAVRCVGHFDKNVFVSRQVMDSFQTFCPVKNGTVLYNTNDSEKILAAADEPVDAGVLPDSEIKLIGVGKLEEVKGFDRLARVHQRLRREGYGIHTYILGEGSKEAGLREYVCGNFTLLGYQTNPYKYVANCDVFVCSSHSEGFSTAATEALIVGTPVCTTEVSGMREMLGENNEYGVVVPNDEEALYQGIKRLLDDPALLAHYKKQAALRGKDFRTEETVKAVEEMLLNL